MSTRRHVEFICRRCAHIVIRDPVELLAFGPETMTLAQIRARARCQRCDSRDVGVYEVMP